MPSDNNCKQSVQDATFVLKRWCNLVWWVRCIQHICVQTNCRNQSHNKVWNPSRRKPLLQKVADIECRWSDRRATSFPKRWDNDRELADCSGHNEDRISPWNISHSGEPRFVRRNCWFRSELCSFHTSNVRDDMFCRGPEWLLPRWDSCRWNKFLANWHWKVSLLSFAELDYSTENPTRLLCMPNLWEASLGSYWRREDCWPVADCTCLVGVECTRAMAGCWFLDRFLEVSEGPSWEVRQVLWVCS